MKKRLLALGLLIFLGIAWIGGAGCSSTPSSPEAAAPTATPTVDIVWAYPSIYSYGSGQNAFMYLRVNGQPVTNAAVTLSGTFTGAPVAMPPAGFVTFGGTTVYAVYATTSFNYELNKVYTLSTTTMGKTASSSVTSPGGISQMTDSNGAVTQASWTYAGTNEDVTVQENSPTSQSTFFLVGSALSPVTIPDAGGSNAYPDGSGSNYSVEVDVKNVTTTVTNASFGESSDFDAYNYLITIVTLP